MCNSISTHTHANVCVCEREGEKEQVGKSEVTLKRPEGITGFILNDL